jgi:hypothetical protein
MTPLRFIGAVVMSALAALALAAPQSQAKLSSTLPEQPSR